MVINTSEIPEEQFSRIYKEHKYGNSTLLRISVKTSCTFMLSSQRGTHELFIDSTMPTRSPVWIQPLHYYRIQWFRHYRVIMYILTAQ